MWSAESGTAMDSGIEVSTAFNAANAQHVPRSPWSETETV